MANLRTSNKDSCKAIRTQLVDKYRKPYCEIEETTSWPDGLEETFRFSPFLHRPVRRTDSADDIQRYKNYFSIARKNQGENFTWNHYCDILLADLRNADVIVSLNKMSIQPSGAPVRTHVSNSAMVTRSASSISQVENHKPQKRVYRDINTDVESISSLDDVKAVHTPPKNVLKMSSQLASAPVRSHVSNSAIVTRSASSVMQFKNHKRQKREYHDINTDVESISSLDDLKAFHTPPKNVLKKMCTEIRSLAQKTCKTVEKMTTTTKHCTACGSVIISSTVHKKCSKQRIVKTDCNKPITPGMLKSSNVSKKSTVYFESPSIKTPCGASAFLDDGRSRKLRGKALFQP